MIWSGIDSRGYILFPSVMISILLSYAALEKMNIPTLPENLIKVGSYIGLVLLTIAFCSTHIISYYKYVYRDNPVNTLTYRMERGVYRGLYTLEQRGKALIYLEDEIQKVTSQNDTVLFMDQAPQAYLMTHAMHNAPSTWNILQYTYVYNDRFVEGFDSRSDLPLQEYFRIAGREPDKIIYVQDKERLEQLSLWDDDYKFNQYVSKYYEQTYSNNADQFAIIVFVRIR